MDTSGEEGSNDSAGGEQEAIKVGSVGGNSAGDIVEKDASSRTNDAKATVVEENGSENDLEHHQAPVRTSPRMASSTKRKTKDRRTCSTPKIRKRARHDIEDCAPAAAQSKSRKMTSFDERCNQILQYKKRFRDCNVPQWYTENKSLGSWCAHVRAAQGTYKKGDGTKVQSPTSHKTVWINPRSLDSNVICHMSSSLTRCSRSVALS